MTDQEINIAIAEACGWTNIRTKNLPQFQDDRRTYLLGTLSGSEEIHIPAYSNDLNAMHEAEKTLTGKQVLEYVPILNRCTKCFSHITPAIMIFATARQRAEAFLRTIGKWKE